MIVSDVFGISGRGTVASGESVHGEFRSGEVALIWHGDQLLGRSTAFVELHTRAGMAAVVLTNPHVHVEPGYGSRAFRTRSRPRRSASRGRPRAADDITHGGEAGQVTRMPCRPAEVHPSEFRYRRFGDVNRNMALTAMGYPAQPQPWASFTVRIDRDHDEPEGEDALAWRSQTIPGRLGIPAFKLETNDRWLVTVPEIKEALQAYARAPHDLRTRLEADSKWCACRNVRPCWSGAVRAPMATVRVCAALPSSLIARHECAMMPARAAATGLPRDHERVRVVAAAAGQRPRQGRRNPGPAPSTRNAAPPTQRATGPVRPRRPSMAGRAAAPTTQAACGCWYAPTRSCAGTVTPSHAATRSVAPTPAGQTAHPSLDSRARAAPGRGQPILGLLQGARELLILGITVAASTVWEILRAASINPAPERAATTWTQFLRSQADALLAADFIETVTLAGARMYILTVIEHASRRTRILGATAHPNAAWVTQTARNLVMDPQDTGCRTKYLIRDRDGKYPAAFDQALTDAGITVIRSGIRMPRMNSIIERWVRTCRHELLDRTLNWNHRHLLHALREFEIFYNAHRPHQGIANTRPIAPLPEPITDPDQLA